MKTIIETVEEAITKEQWNYEYHSDKADTAVRKLNQLRSELVALKETISATTIGQEQ